MMTISWRRYSSILWGIFLTFSILNVYNLLLLLQYAPLNVLQRFEYLAHPGGPSQYSNTGMNTDIFNSTLGFGKVYVLGLPERSDKRDSMQLVAALTGLDITWIDGVKGETMSDVAVPPSFFDSETEHFSQRSRLGSWRGHINVIREIISKDVESALVMEDDMDWDVNIHLQLRNFSRSSNALLESLNLAWPINNTASRLNSPYGADWDILWLGHCGGWSPPLDARQYQSILNNDDTVPPSFHIEDLTRGLGPDSAPCTAHPGRDPEFVICNSPRLRADQRVIQVKGSPICSFAYALSQRGARKALLKLGGPGLPEVNAGFDTKLTELCRGDMDIAGGDITRCLTVSPPYFMQHRPRGSMKGDSDIENSTIGDDQGGGSRDVGVTRGIVWSTRLNAANLIEGKEVESQYIWETEKSGWRCKKLEEYRGGKNEKAANYRAGVVGS